MRIAAKPLSQAEFSDFGHVLSTESEPRRINRGRSIKWDRLVPHASFSNDELNIGIIETSPSEPRVNVVERHFHTAQLFYPVTPARYLVVVGSADLDDPQAGQLKAFVASDRLGVCFAAGTWHSPLIALDGGARFFTMMRHTAVPDLDLRDLPDSLHIDLEEQTHD